MLTSRRETVCFVAGLSALIAALLGESLVGGKVLSPADVLFVQQSFAEFGGPAYEPANRLLIDPVLQFQPWIEFNRTMLRQGRLPLWNGLVGCGAPHLANGQSAVFDPFHLIAYLGPLPEAHAWMAAARLWVAGLGMYWLASRWGLGPWGRWFAGLAFPLSGFLVVWLLFPVTSTAVWLPWMFLATDAVLDRPTWRRGALPALVVGLTLIAGHVQTSAHVLLAGGSYAAWRGWMSWRRRRGSATTSGAVEGRLAPGLPRDRVLRGPALWVGGVVLGASLAAIQIVPLGVYLTRSPVWTDRAAARASVWELTRPRVLDAACTALPYLYGSQRRGHPNLARALGVHNLNESAGGFAGLATLIWLAPLGWASRQRQPRVRFLVGLAGFGFLGAFDVPPVANLLRALPVLDVMDHRRLTLWVAFSLVLLGGVGLDTLSAGSIAGRGWSRWIGLWGVGALALVAIAMLTTRMGPTLESRALAHYASTASETPGADPKVFEDRARRQVRDTLRFVPRYTLLAAAQFLGLAALAMAFRRRRLVRNHVRLVLISLVLIDLFAFAHGMNPAVAREADRPESALIAYLRREVRPPARVLAVGAELPPNTLMRYGIADVRNYDSIEVTRNLRHFDALYEPVGNSPAAPMTSRRLVTWDGVARAFEELRAAGVTAVVGASPPPDGLFDRVDRVAAVWIGRIHTHEHVPTGSAIDWDHGRIAVRLEPGRRGLVQVPETYDPGWQAEWNGLPVEVRPARGSFLGVERPSEGGLLILRYNPVEVRLGLAVSMTAAVLLGAALVLPVGIPEPRKNANGSWKPARRRVTIGFVTSPRSSSPASLDEG